MARLSISRGDSHGPIPAPIVLLAAVALLAGLYGRFKGIGTWPLGVDEFYTSRSIDHVLRSGIPRFPCGGYYTRGLAYQYLVAGLRLLGLAPEFAGRLVAGLSSLAVLPAVYIVARRLHSSLAGWLTVIILCVSIWEIEMARFARMYAPFQAVFAWYVVFYLRYTVDKNLRALAAMIVLSVLGVLTWEGGILLGVANLFAIVLAHEHGRLKRADIVRLAGLLVLLTILLLAARDLRGFPGSEEESFNHSGVAVAWFAPLRQNPGWGAGLLLPLGFACAALPWIWSYRRRWLAGAGLLAALTAAGLHLFVVTGGLLVLMLFARLIEWEDLSGRRARYFQIALASLFVFWLAFEFRTGAAGTAASLTQHLFGFPSIYDEVIRPWGRTLPILSAGLLLTFVYLAWTTVSTRGDAVDPIAVLLSLVLLMVLTVGATQTPRIETRYTFFLYPQMIALAVAAVLMMVRRLGFLSRAPVMLGALAPLLYFVATEDFQARHLAAVDSADINFRVGMSPVNAAHYYPRDDIRALARWYATHVRPNDVVITGISSLDEYYGNFDYFFLDKEDSRYEAYVCRDGRTERWSNHSLLYGEEALSAVIASGRRVFASVYPDTENRLVAAAQRHDWSVTRVWTTGYGNDDVLLIAAKSGVGN
jgi:hypothetical protein